MCHSYTVILKVQLYFKWHDDTIVLSTQCVCVCVVILFYLFYDFLKLIPANTPLWDGAYKRTLAATWKE